MGKRIGISVVALTGLFAAIVLYSYETGGSLAKALHISKASCDSNADLASACGSETNAKNNDIFFVSCGGIY